MFPAINKKNNVKKAKLCQQKLEYEPDLINLGVVLKSYHKVYTALTKRKISTTVKLYCTAIKARWEKEIKSAES